MEEDRIHLRGIRVSSHIGVPDDERALPQTLEIDLILVPVRTFTALNDELDRTIDYHGVWQRARALAAAKPRKLIETLAEELAVDLLGDPRIRRVGVEVRKFILPDTASVSVVLWRSRAGE